MKKRKRIQLVLAALLIPLLLAACAAKRESDLVSIQNAPPPTVAGQEPSPETETLSYQVEMEELADTVCTEDGTPLLSYRFYLPVMTPFREDGTIVTAPGEQTERQALTVAETFNSNFKKWAAEEDLDHTVAAAEEELAFRLENGLDSYYLELSCSAYRTGQLVSVQGVYLSDTGGAHPNSWCLGWNFDLTTGSFISPEALAADAAGFQRAVFEELVRQAEETAQTNGMPPEDFFWADYQEILANWGSYAVSFDEDGMKVAFSPYELACYAAGEQIFSVSYDWLAPQLNEHGRQVLGIAQP